MIDTAQSHSPFRRRAGAAFAGAMLTASLAAAPAFAQQVPTLDTKRGAFLIHGNFCGPGNRGPRFKPIDALDRACMHHDACSPPRGQIATCSCNDRLRVEAEAVATHPGTPQSLRETAELVADTAMLLPCR